MIRHASGFAAGFTAPWRGLAMIVSESRIRSFAVFPFLAVVVVLAVGLSIGLPLVTGWVSPIVSWVLSLLASVGLATNAGAATALEWALSIFIWPALVVGLLALLWLIARLISAPFLALLSERVLMVQGAIDPKPFRLFQWLRTQFKLIRISLQRSLLLGAVSLVLVLISLVPGLGLLTSVALLVVLAFDVADFALEALELDLQDRVKFYRANFSVFLGLGLMLGLVFLVPGLNFFLLPASVVGASDIVCKRRPEKI